MNFVPGLRASSMLLFMAFALVPAGNANDTAAQPVEEAAARNEATAKERYEQLMKQAEGDGRSCMVADSFKNEMLEALKVFAKTVRFIDLDPNRPIQVELPEGYYHPLGCTISFDQFELAVDRTDPSRPYVSMTRTSEGVRLEPKVSIRLKDGKLLCVRNLSATVSYGSKP